MKEKVDNFMDTTLGFLSGTKFNSKARGEKADRKLQAYSKILRSISYLGDNRGEGVRDLGNGFVRLTQRVMNLVLDLPAISLLSIKTLGTANKIRKGEEIKEEDLKSLDDSLKLKALGIAGQQLMLNTVKRGIGKMHIEFGGVVKSLDNIQWWKKKVDDMQGGLKQIPVINWGTGIIKNIIDSRFKSLSKEELEKNLPDDLVDTSSRLINIQ